MELSWWRPYNDNGSWVLVQLAMCVWTIVWYVGLLLQMEVCMVKGLRLVNITIGRRS